MTSADKEFKENIKRLETLGFKKPNDFKVEESRYWISSKCISKIAKMCEFWKQYLPNKDFSNLAYKSLADLYRIGVAGSNMHKDSRVFIGNYCNISEEDILPEFLKITILRNGDAYRQIKFGGRDIEF